MCVLLRCETALTVLHDSIGSPSSSMCHIWCVLIVCCYKQLVK
jgi:hypothetical protein